MSKCRTLMDFPSLDIGKKLVVPIDMLGCLAIHEPILTS